MISDRHGVSPAGWEQVASPLGAGQWLLGSGTYLIIAVVPPGAPAGYDEAITDQVRWRKLMWPADDPGRPWERASRQIVAVDEINALLPEQFRPWIRAACAQQLKQLEEWSAPSAGHGHEQRAHDAAFLRDTVRRECCNAFPADRWHASDATKVPSIPQTVDALLHRIDFPDPARADELWHFIETHLERAFYSAVEVARWVIVRRRLARRKIDEWLADSASPAASGPIDEVDHERQDTGQHEVLVP
jgi:hypothetical protein